MFTAMNATLSKDELEAVNKIIMDQLTVQLGQITPEAIFGHDLGADSLDMVEIGMQVEEQFDLTTSDSEIGVDSSVGELYKDLAEQLTHVQRR